MIRKPIRETFGRDLDQDLLKTVIEETFHPEEDYLQELITKWQDETLEYIAGEVLACANDFYMDEALSPEEIININDLIIQLRTE